MTKPMTKAKARRGNLLMARLRRLWVIHTTANVANADTENRFDLVIDHSFPNPNFEARLHFPDLPNPDERARERARTDEYPFDVESLAISASLLSGDDLRIEILGNDAWLPSTLWSLEKMFQE
jgi:hypothetical protein